MVSESDFDRDEITSAAKGGDCYTTILSTITPFGKRYVL